MPLVAHSDLPSFDRLRKAGQEVLDVERARHQDIRELHIGLLNLMPDAALEATERQFMRLLGASSRIVQLYVHPFTVPGLARGTGAQAHIDRYYENFEQIQQGGLDGLIITGANVTQPDLAKEAFYEPMCEVFDWASKNVASVLCSCLASHALWQHQYGVKRRHLGQKRWGVFEHHVTTRSHPLVSNINTRFYAPHSRFNDVDADSLEQAGARVLVKTAEGETLLAVSDDGFSAVYLQGHPEYDAMSLAKEYKREVQRFFQDEIDAMPPFPVNYLNLRSEALLQFHSAGVTGAKKLGKPLPDFPEAQLAMLLDNTWVDTGKAIFNNWLGLIYQTTHLDRCQRYMEHVSAKDPLNWVRGYQNLAD